MLWKTLAENNLEILVEHWTIAYHHGWSLGGAIPKDYKFEKFQIGVDIFQWVVTVHPSRL